MGIEFRMSGWTDLNIRLDVSIFATDLLEFIAKHNPYS